MAALRAQLLARLLASRGFVSGADLSRDLGISRGAIWKHIEALRREGYEIAGSPRRGYRLMKQPDSLLPPLFFQLLSGTFGRSYYYYRQVRSTMDVARELARQGAPEGTLVVAEEQTGGRGRRGRVWFSPRGGLWFSLILRPPVSPALTPSLPLYLSLAVAKAITAVVGTPAQLKWPNDILLEGKKAGGILVELSAEAEVVSVAVAGIGLNVNLTSFPPELGTAVTSLQNVTGREIDRGKLLAACLKFIEENYPLWCATGFTPFREEYKARLTLLGTEVTVHSRNGAVHGRAVDVDGDGRLVLLLPQGEKRFLAGGEVTLKKE